MKEAGISAQKEGGTIKKNRCGTEMTIAYQTRSTNQPTEV
jgi:hypothetical protein